VAGPWCWVPFGLDIVVGAMSVTAARRGSLRDRPGVVGARFARVDPAAAVVALLTLGAFVLRLTQMDQSLFGDEVGFTYPEVVGHSLGSTVHAVHASLENAPPLFFMLAWASAKLGDPTVWIRLPSLILGVATIPLVFVVGRDTLGRAPAVLAAAILAASPFSTYYGIEARPYATMAFFLTLSTLALVRAVRTSSVRWWLLYALAAAAAAYSHYTSVFVLAVQAAWSLWVCRDRLREPLLANLLVVLVYVPWLPYVRSRGLAIGLLSPLTAHGVLVDLSRPIAGYPYASPHAIPTIAGLAVIGGFALLGLAAAGWRARGVGLLPAGREAGGLPLIVALALATPVGALLYSILSTDIWDARSLYASVPAAALILAALLWAVPRIARPLAIAAVLATLVAGTIRSISPSYVRPPFRVAAAYLDRAAARSDPIIFYPTFVTMDIRAQFKLPHRVMSSSSTQWHAVASGGTAYLVIDDVFARLLRIGTPRPRGFALVWRRHYSSQVWPFTLLAYRPLPKPSSSTSGTALP
jgi:mannosyltransferase